MCVCLYVFMSASDSQRLQKTARLLHSRLTFRFPLWMSVGLKLSEECFLLGKGVYKGDDKIEQK